MGVVLLGLACGGSPSPSPATSTKQVEPERVEPNPEPVALEVLFSGCREVRAGPVCVYDPKTTTLRIWANVDAAFGPKLWFDGTAFEAEAEAVEGGQRWVVSPPEGARALEVRADLDGKPGRYALTLDPSPDLVIPALDELTEMRRANKFEQVRQRMAELLPTFEGKERVKALMRAGDVAFLMQDHEGIEEMYSKGYEEALEHGLIRDASTMAQRLIYLCVALRPDEECTRTWLERDAPLAAVDHEQLPLHNYYRGLYQTSLGNLRDALTAHEQGARHARALGLVLLEAGAVTEQMLLVGRVGAWERATELRKRAESLQEDSSATARGQLINTVAWMLLEARARQSGEAEDPTPMLLRAKQVLDWPDIVSQRMHTTIGLNLAYAAVLDGKADEARKWLAEIADEELPHHEERLWRDLLHARVAFLSGNDAEARRRFGALAGEAERRYEPELLWHALLGQAEVLERRGKLDDALVAYGKAEQVLDEQLPRIAMGEGRARFIAERDRGTRRLVGLLLRMDRPEEALCTARLARTRALRAVARQMRASNASAKQRQALQDYRDERTRLERAWDESWSLPAAAARQRQRELSAQRKDNQEAFDRALGGQDAGVQARCEDLASVPADRLDLHFVELDEGWVGFAVDDQGVSVQQLGAVESRDDGVAESWGPTLVEPFAEAIAGAKSLRVMPTGALNRVPFHALPAPGAPERMLIDLLPVWYGLDLPGRSAQAGPRPAGRATIVAPPSNLRSAPGEVEGVDEALRAAGWTVQRLEGEQAQGDVVRGALTGVDLLHYVGHARADELGGWSSALSLARDGTVDVGDVLVLGQTPPTVVLNGCETGRTDPQALAGGMSLAHAFVLGGSDLVIATDREVDDKAAAALVKVFYESFAAGRDAPKSLQTALQTQRNDDEGWLHTRGWGP